MKIETSLTSTMQCELNEWRPRKPRLGALQLNDIAGHATSVIAGCLAGGWNLHPSFMKLLSHLLS